MVDLAGGDSGEGPVDVPSIISERWAIPATPNANDVEFVQTLAELLADGWILVDGAGTTVAVLDDTIDPYVNDAAAHHINGHTYRPSWLTLKIRNNNTRYYFVKPFAPVTNEFIWTRMGTRSVAVDDGNDVGLVVMAATAGHPDPANRSEVILVQTAGGRRIRGNVVTAGVQTQYYNGGPSADFQTPVAPYFGMQKTNTTYKGWYGQEGHGHFSMTSGVQASAMAYFGFVCQVNDGTPGNGIAQADFVRFVENTTTFLF